MEITDQCKAAMNEHGVLMNGDVPAGAYLLQKPVLNIYIARPDSNGNLPQGAIDPGSMAALRNAAPALLRPTWVPPPSGFEGFTREAMGFWRTNAVQFVSTPNQADIKIAVFKATSPPSGDYVELQSAATSPVHDADFGGKWGDRVPVLAIQTIDGINNPKEYFTKVIRHELGHAFGIRHPELAFDRSGAVCESSHKSDIPSGIMSENITDKPGAYDIRARDMLKP